MLFRVALLALVVLLPTLLFSQQPLPDYEVKAAFLYHFTQFIEWPLPNRNSTFLICVADDPATAAALERLTRGKWLNSHPLRVRNVSTAREAPSCRVLFVAGTARPEVQQYLQVVCASSILTVGEGPAFRELGGMIELFLQDQRIAFRLNVPAMQRAHLNPSSRLLQLGQAESHVHAEGYY
jgi:hypothetical protein